MPAVMEAPKTKDEPVKAKPKLVWLYSIFPRYQLCMDKAQFVNRETTDGKIQAIKTQDDTVLDFREHRCPVDESELPRVKAAMMYGHDFITGSELASMLKVPAANTDPKELQRLKGLQLAGRAFLERMSRRSKVGGGKEIVPMDMIEELRGQ